MPHFPVSHSVLSAEALGHFVGERYGLGSVNCRLIRSGLNGTYRVETETATYVFRVYSLGWRTEREIREEIRLLELLRQNDISVSYALPDLQQNHIQILPAPEGDRYGVLFTLAPGEKIIYMAEDVHRHIGQLMARLHQVTLGLSLDRITYTPTVLLTDSFAKLNGYLPGCEERDFMESALQTLMPMLENADTQALRHGAVHLDIWFDNLNIDASGQVTLFDFDFCGNGWLCLDLAYYVMQLYHLERDETVCQAKLQAFLSGYESVSPIPDEEKHLLPALGVALYFFYLGTQCERFHNWSNVFLNEVYLKRFISQIVQRYFHLHRLGETA